MTRRRWLTTKLTVGGAALAVLGLVMGFSVTVWVSVFADLYPNPVYSFFNLHGILLAVEWLCAFLIGTTAGALVRRTVAAMAVTVLTVFAIGVVLATTSSGYTPANTTAGVLIGAIHPIRAAARSGGRRSSGYLPADRQGHRVAVTGRRPHQLGGSAIGTLQGLPLWLARV